MMILIGNCFIINAAKYYVLKGKIFDFLFILGAIMDLNLVTKQNLVPLMLYHGDHDNLVTYKTAAHHFCDPSSTGWLMLFGSSSIYNHIVTLGGSAKLYTFNGSGHEVANYYFEKEMEQVLNFCRMALSNKKFQSKVVINL